jgi:hypothetical protein
VLVFSLVLIALGWGVRFAGASLDFLGTLNGFISMGPNMAIFILTSRWIAPEAPDLPKWSRWLAIGVMATDALYFTMFSNMRNLIVWPIVAYGLPFILRKALTPRRLAVGTLFVLCFAVAFKTVGELRGQIFGTERLTQMVQQSPLVESDMAADDDDADRWGFVSLLARLSTFNQLSQVVRIAHEEGYYNGETLEYLVYVFIPRMVWAEKPVIAPGQWFAEKIGRGWRWEDSRYSNAVNMTIPGELYLNYGWLGTVAGLSLLSFLYFVFWESAGYYREEYNPLGRAFAFVLLAQALFSGSHIGGMVNLVLWYLACLAVSVALSSFLKRTRAAKAKADARRPGRSGSVPTREGFYPSHR